MSTPASTPDSTPETLVAAVRAAAEGTPYVVRETDYGFDLTIDVVDAQWYTLLRKNGVRKVFTHEVRLKPGRRLTITDVENEVRWDAGVTGGRPSLHASKSVQRGRVYEFSSEKQWGVDARTGELGKVVDYTFRAGEGRELVRRAAADAGWKEGMGGEQKGALVVGVGTLVLLAVGGIAVLVAHLLG